ncbi:MFS transporter [Streptomyces stramineus]
MWAFVQAPQHGWTDGRVTGVAAVGTVLLALMLCWEGRVRSPMLPLSLFRDRGYAVAVGTLSALFFTLVGSTFILTFHLQGLRGMSPLEAGSTMVLGGLGVTCGGALAAAGARRAAARHMMVTGLVLCGIAFLVLAGVSAESGDGRLHVFLLVVGLGTGLAGGPATSLIMGAVPGETSGVGAAVNDAVRSVGSTSGVAIMGSAFNTFYSSAMRDQHQAPPGGAAHGARDHLLTALSQARDMAAGAGPSGSARNTGQLEAAKSLAYAARTAFVTALQNTACLSAALCFTGAGATLFLLRETRRTHGSAPVRTGTTTTSGCPQ